MVGKIKTREDAAILARSCEWLSRQEPRFQDDLLAACELRVFAPDETLCRAGDPHNGVFCLVSGVVKGELMTLGNDFWTAYLEQPVYWFGECATLAGDEYGFTVTAVTPVTALWLPKRGFNELIRNPDYCKSFAQLAIRHLRKAHLHAQLLLGTAERRIAAGLVLLSEMLPCGKSAVLRAAHQDLAEMCGVARATVTSVLKTFEEKSLVRTGYKRIEITDVEAMVSEVGRRPLY